MSHFLKKDAHLENRVTSQDLFECMYASVDKGLLDQGEETSETYAHS